MLSQRRGFIYYAYRTGRTLYESVPPKLYGGTERVVSYLTEELVRLGHDVTLFPAATPKLMQDWSGLPSRPLA